MNFTSQLLPENNYLENYTLKFIELNNKDLQHCLYIWFDFSQFIAILGLEEKTQIFKIWCHDKKS